MWARRKQRALSAWEAALCGSAAGGIAAAVTCPVDVVKTRIMLETNSGARRGLTTVLPEILKNEGAGALWAGVRRIFAVFEKFW